MLLSFSEMLLGNGLVSPTSLSTKMCIALPIFHCRNPRRDVVLHVRTVVPPLHMYTWLSSSDSPVITTVCMETKCVSFGHFNYTLLPHLDSVRGEINDASFTRT